MISVKVLPDFDSRRCLLTALLFLYASNSLLLSSSSCFGSMFNWVAFDCMDLCVFAAVFLFFLQVILIVQKSWTFDFIQSTKANSIYCCRGFHGSELNVHESFLLFPFILVQSMNLC